MKKLAITALTFIVLAALSGTAIAQTDANKLMSDNKANCCNEPAEEI